jgi:ubiquinone/menaquinone biosynthesis C-methylase UbiE
MSSLFEAADYLQYRIHYPASIFAALKPYLRKNCRVLDLGAGTGFATASFLEFFPPSELTLVEPDTEMLAAARARLKDFPQIKTTVQSSAETMSFAPRSFDVVLIASAWHWMQFEKTAGILAELVKPGGVVFVCEYQFPKASGEALELNEWVRRQFNLNWRAPAQVPRGSLFEITEAFRQSPAFAQVAKTELTDTQSHSANDFAGMIFSQSRFLHYETSLSAGDRKNLRAEILRELKIKFDLQNEIPFLYLFQALLFQRRPD